MKSNTGACSRSRHADTSFKLHFFAMELINFQQINQSYFPGMFYRDRIKKKYRYGKFAHNVSLANRYTGRVLRVEYIEIAAIRKSPGILELRDIFQYLPSVSVPGLALQALILHYINKGLKNQGCRGKQIGVVEASRYSANTRLPSLSIFLLHYVFHLRAKRYYTTGVESNIIFLRARM